MPKRPARRPKLSGSECQAITRDLRKHPRVTSVVQRMATEGSYPVIVVRIKHGPYRSIATFEEYLEVKASLSE